MDVQKNVNLKLALCVLGILLNVLQYAVTGRLFHLSHVMLDDKMDVEMIVLMFWMVIHVFKDLLQLLQFVN